MSVLALAVHAEVAVRATGLGRLSDTVPDAADIKPGWVALVIVLLLSVATTLLWLNMRKQLGKIKFEERDTRSHRDDDPPAR